MPQGALCFIHEFAKAFKDLPEQPQGECGYVQTDGQREGDTFSEIFPTKPNFWHLTLEI